MKKTVPIHFSEEQYDRLREAAFVMHVSMGQVVRNALDNYLVDYEPKNKPGDGTGHSIK